MTPLYPLKFQPLLKRYLWGGRRLGEVLGKPLGEGADYAESWEVADHRSDQSVVANGPLAGTTLNQLVAERGQELLGRHARIHNQPRARFPLLFKYLDCNRDLSVQVHPDDAAASRLDPPDLGKTEAWVILEANPGSRVYAGLKPGVDRQSLSQAIDQGQTESCLSSFEPRAGDCIFIPAGTVHALGAGLLVAEIQQASDTTYRLFDWNRVDADGRPRPLHVREALDVIDYSACDVRPNSPQPTDEPHVERLATCDKFVLDRWRIDGSQDLGGDDRFHIVSVIEGSICLAPLDAGRVGDDLKLSFLTRGDTLLIPASTSGSKVGAVAARGPCVLLDMYLP